jgi:hypothetical protein
MASMKPDEGSVAQGPTHQNRREALKQFGRFAAVAPTTMLLLAPRSGHAHHRGWHTPPGPFTNPGRGRGADKPGRGGGYED